MLRRVVVTAALAGACLLPAATASAASSEVKVTHATVTAAPKGGDTAIELTFQNTLGRPVSLMSITSTVAGQDMLFYDNSMTSSNESMLQLANILVPAKSKVVLGYQYDGAMFSRLHEKLSVGEKVTLALTWSDFQSVHHEVVTAKVVAKPKGLRFLMGGMVM